MDNTNFAELTKYARIGVMGGTFDPIHYGHLLAAEVAREGFGLDYVLFIPSGRPPHKDAGGVSDAESRYEMTRLAVAGEPRFGVSRMETDRVGDTYTIDTMRALRSQLPDAELYFITGADALNEIETWHDYRELLRMCGFIAVTRPGYNDEKLRRQVAAFNRDLGSAIHFLEISAFPGKHSIMAGS